MLIPDDYEFTRYLAAKRTVDDRALNRCVWDTLIEKLAAASTTGPLRVLELGAGSGAMLERLLASGALTDAVYTAIDADAGVIEDAKTRLPNWADEHGWRVDRQPDALRLTRPGRKVRMRCEAIDLFDFIERQGKSQSWDLLVAHAVLDVLDLDTALPVVLSALRPGGLFYFPITYDGATIVEPEIDAEFDALVEACYHETMDQRIVRGRRSGDSRTGRRLFSHLTRVGGEVLAAGSSDWVIFARNSEYPADEAYFLHFLIQTMGAALAGHRRIDQDRFADWIQRRHAQVEEGTLVFIAHQLDVLGRRKVEA